MLVAPSSSAFSPCPHLSVQTPTDWLPTGDGKVSPQRVFPFHPFLEIMGEGQAAPTCCTLAPGWGGCMGVYRAVAGAWRGPGRKQATAGCLAASPSCLSLPRPRPPEAAALLKLQRQERWGRNAGAWALGQSSEAPPPLPQSLCRGSCRFCQGPECPLVPQGLGWEG